LHTYGEISQSGSGIKFIGRAKLSGDGTRRNGFGDGSGAIEIYDRLRYFALTGWSWKEKLFAESGFDDVQDLDQNFVDQLYVELKAPKEKAKPSQPGESPTPHPVDDSDEALLAYGRKHCKNFAAWFDRGEDVHGDDSANDLGLMNHLAFLTGRDAARMERLFSESALGQREKWTDRKDYRDRTISEAIKGCDRDYEPRRKSTKTGNKTSAPGTKRPEIMITTREHEVTDQAVAAIAADSNLFQRGGNLVAILEDCRPQPKQTGIKRPPGSLRISLLPHAQIRRLMTVHADWLKVKIVRGKQEIVQAHPPTWTVEAVATLGTWKGIRPLEGIVEAPTLRPDGSLIDQPGYDSDTGLWFVPSEVFPSIPDNPTVIPGHLSVTHPGSPILTVRS